MKNWEETLRSLTPDSSDNSCDLKIKGGKGLILIQKLKEKRLDQLDIMADQTRQSDILDHHKIIEIYNELIIEVSLQMELIDIRLKELQVCTQ